MSNSVQAEIDLAAVRNNLRQVRKLAPTSRILAMVKADAYGHGMVRVAATHALEGADAFGVASFEEAMVLRSAGINEPIVIMSRFDRAEQLSLCGPNNFAVVVHQPYQVKIIENNPLKQPLCIWLKLEIGMNRLGLLPEQFVDAWQRLQKISWVKKPLILMSHFACADEPEHPLTNQQIKVFKELTDHLPGPKSLSNSAAICSRPEVAYDWVRPGIMLYGASPIKNKTASELGLEPVMTFKSRLISIKPTRKGETVGYGATQKCPEDILLGVAAVGYGDGYPRHACTGTPVLVNGKRCRLFGRVSMDMIALDLRATPDAKVGDSVILWGKGLPAEEIADSAETITYELFCHVNRRVEFITRD